MKDLGVRQTTLLVAGVLVALLLEQGCGFASGGERGEVVERWENSAHGLTIRVTEFKEKNPVSLTHFFYVFESLSSPPNEWTEIMAVKNDDDVPIPPNQIVFVNSKFAYAFMNEKYAVTIDSGQTWTVWEAIPSNLSKLQSKANIRDVHVNPDGTGRMELDSLLSGQMVRLTISTNDYGRHWNFD